MITCNSKGEIIVEINDKSYNFSVSEEYVEFLLWVTSPDSATVIDKDMFVVDETVEEVAKDKVSRYAEFLSAFAQRRKNKLDEITDLTAERRETDIKDFIERLNMKER